MVEFTRGMSKQATSPPTALGQWHPASSLRTRQSGGLHDTTSGNLQGLNLNFLEARCIVIYDKNTYV